MKVITASHEILTELDRNKILNHIENCGRQCYQSTHLVKDGSASGFVQMIMQRGHHSVIEHCSMSIKFIVDRGITHEMVRHRLASFSQESTRFCNYGGDRFGNEINVIDPCTSIELSPKMNKLTETDMQHYRHLLNVALEQSELIYNKMIDHGIPPEYARGVLPNATKASIVITANMREWREIFSQRAVSEFAHPQIREVMIPALLEVNEYLPEIFLDLVNQLPMWVVTEYGSNM